MVADEGEGPSRKRAREEEGTLASPPDADTTQFLPCTTPAPMLAEEGDAAPASAQPMGTQLPDEDDGAPPPRQQQPQPERAALLAAGEAGAPASPAAAPLSCGGSDSEDDRGNYVEEGDFSSDDGEGLQRELVAQLGRYMQARAMFEALAARRKRWACRNCTDVNYVNPPGFDECLRLYKQLGAATSPGYPLPFAETVVSEEEYDELARRLEVALEAALNASSCSTLCEAEAPPPLCDTCSLPREEAPPGAGRPEFELAPPAGASGELLPQAPLDRPLVTYDRGMLEHDELKEEGAMGGPHPERPDRLRAAVGSLAAKGLLARMHFIKPRAATRPELLAAHTPEMVARIEQTAVVRPPSPSPGVLLMAPESAERPEGALARLEAVAVGSSSADGGGATAGRADGASDGVGSGSAAAQPVMEGTPPQVTYLTADTFANLHSARAAKLAAGAAAQAAQAVVRGDAPSAVALVRPPGHHAEQAKSMGFCLFNNAAVAARAAQAAGAQRVLIFDWDVHHCNGTQDIFRNDPSVLVVSIHRFDGGQFYPGTGAARARGEDEGQGFNINVAWPCGGVSDRDYMAAMQTCVLPVAYEYKPDVIIISAGFDAARGDPLGGCDVTPVGYAHMLWSLLPITGGKIVLLLEGGYNLRSLASSTDACVETLLGKVPPPLPAVCEQPTPHCAAALREMLRAHADKWKSLRHAHLSLNVMAHNVDLAEAHARACGGLPVPSLTDGYRYGLGSAISSSDDDDSSDDDQEEADGDGTAAAGGADVDTGDHTPPDAGAAGGDLLTVDLTPMPARAPLDIGNLSDANEQQTSSEQRGAPLALPIDSVRAGAALAAQEDEPSTEAPSSGDGSDGDFVP